MISATSLVAISRALARRVDRLVFAPPVAYVYNPLAYAAALHEAYLVRYGGAAKEVVLLGMNPGPFGMAQTGVPFGDVATVRDFLGLRGEVGCPRRQHPKRRIQGLACPRGEVSGARLWGWVRDDFGSAERFFARFFVGNYCPLVFMEASGRNLTPDKLPAREQGALFSACDEALRATVELLRPRHVVGVGAFAAGRARRALADMGVAVGTILHPSPASPLANRGWAAQARRQLSELGISIPRG
ncbi:MAG: single-stranded DNA-binding protein [Deltaproteobacteria bacterium]|jgi:single-strand selective monofunctional uracil DNA glycosylase|nr:single-stranded DNA-binding protein [Deltaproteobacteria bacterium]